MSVSLRAAKEDKIRTIEGFIKPLVKSKFQADIDNVGWMIIDGLNGQPGLYMDPSKMNTFKRSYWAGNFAKMKETMPTGPIVLVDTTAPDSGGTLWMGVLFHEYGHAGFDKLGKNSEKAAWTVEILALWNYLQTNKSDAEVIKTFVLDRRKNQKMYAEFVAGYETQVKDAYADMAAEPL